MLFRSCDDVRKLLERRAERRPLPRSVLENDHGLAPSARGEQLEQTVRNEIEAGCFTAGGVAAGVKNDTLQAERFRRDPSRHPWP